MSASPVFDWIARTVKKGAVRVELWTWRADRPERQVGLWKALPDALEPLAGEIQADAENHGKSQNGQRVPYGLLAYDGAGDKIGEFVVKVAGGNAKDGDSVSNVTDLSGVVAHLIRGNNELSALVIRAFQGRDDTLVKQLELLGARLDAAEKRHADSLIEQQRMLLLSSEQKRLDAQLVQEQERDAFVRDAATVYLPVIANRLLGGGPGKGTPAAAGIVAAITSTLSPAEIDALGAAIEGSAIDQSKKIAFMELLRGAMRQVEQRQKRPLNGDEPQVPAGGKEEPS